MPQEIYNLYSLSWDEMRAQLPEKRTDEILHLNGKKVAFFFKILKYTFKIGIQQAVRVFYRQIMNLDVPYAFPASCFIPVYILSVFDATLWSCAFGIIVMTIFLRHNFQDRCVSTQWISSSCVFFLLNTAVVIFILLLPRLVRCYS